MNHSASKTFKTAAWTVLGLSALTAGLVTGGQHLAFDYNRGQINQALNERGQGFFVVADENWEDTPTLVGKDPNGSSASITCDYVGPDRVTPEITNESDPNYGLENLSAYCDGVRVEGIKTHIPWVKAG